MEDQLKICTVIRQLLYFRGKNHNRLNTQTSQNSTTETLNDHSKRKNENSGLPLVFKKNSTSLKVNFTRYGEAETPASPNTSLKVRNGRRKDSYHGLQNENISPERNVYRASNSKRESSRMQQEEI